MVEQARKEIWGQEIWGQRKSRKSGEKIWGQKSGDKSGDNKSGDTILIKKRESESDLENRNRKEKDGEVKLLPNQALQFTASTPQLSFIVRPGIRITNCWVTPC